MARKEITQYYDDYDNQPLTEEELKVVDFTYNNIDYTLDLSKENATKFHQAITPFVQVARRKVRSGVNGRRTATRSANPERNRMIREWAQAHGIAVSERGRISQDVIDKFEAQSS